MILTALAIAFAHGWLMTLVMVATLLFIFFAAFIFGVGITKYTLHKTEVLNKAGALVEESIRAAKTVKQLSG